MPTNHASGALNTLQHLWPGEPGEQGADGPVLARYRAVPSATSPRFLLPADRRAALSVLRNFRTPGGYAARARLAALRGLVGLSGGWPAARGTLHVGEPVDGRDPAIEQELARVLGTTVVMGIHLGPPRANQKPVLHVMDRGARPRAVAKLGVNELTSSLVDHEASSLARMSERRLSCVRVPSVLHHGRWQGHSWVVLSHLPLARTAPTPPWLLTRAMVDVARSGGVRPLRLAEAPAFRRMTQQAHELGDGAIRRTVDECLRTLMDPRDPVDHGTWHGDWTDWNCAALGVDVLVWDWERCQDGVPLGWDALHHALRRDLQDRQPTREAAGALVARAPSLLEPFGVSGNLASHVARAYLLHLGLRYLVDRQLEAGGPSGRVEEWLLPVVLGR